MKYDFDKRIERKDTGNVKGAYCEKMGIPKGIIPFIGAEFEFPTSPIISNALAEKAASGAYCNTRYDDPAYMEKIKYWMHNVRKWDIECDWVVPTDGIIKAVFHCMNAFTEKGDGVIIQPPVFGSYATEIKKYGRIPFNNTLIYKNNAFSIDFDNLEMLMKKNEVKLMIICNPQNPMGKVYTIDDLEKIALLALKYNIVVFSDEIFADMGSLSHPTVSYGSIENGKKTGIVGTSLGKAFSFAGECHGNIIIADKNLRKKFTEQRDYDFYGGLTTFMYCANMAAYSDENYEWLKALDEYIEGNVNEVKMFFEKNLPEIKVCEHHAGYIILIDWSAWKKSEEALHEYLHKAYLYLDKGSSYGEGYESFTRMVISSPRKYIADALNRLLELTKKEPPVRGD